MYEHRHAAKFAGDVGSRSLRGSVARSKVVFSTRLPEGTVAAAKGRRGMVERHATAAMTGGIPSQADRLAQAATGGATPQGTASKTHAERMAEIAAMRRASAERTASVDAQIRSLREARGGDQPRDDAGRWVAS